MKRPLNLNRQLDEEIIRNMHRVAKEFDLNRGGYCDNRLGCINFWCGPDDKPEGWDIKVEQGCLDFPRACVGTLYFRNLTLEVSPYELEEYYKGKMPTELYENCFKWLEAKVLELVRLADLHPYTVGTKCPLCDYVLPPNRLLNDLVHHMTSHGTVNNIVLGEKTTVRVDGVQYFLEEKEQF